MNYETAKILLTINGQMVTATKRGRQCKMTEWVRRARATL
jgi:hypothetical protein